MNNSLDKKRVPLWVKYAVFGFVALLFTVLDQLTKVWIENVAGGVEGKGIVVIKNILNFTYIKNDGASMGILGGQRIILIILTLGIIALGVWFFVKKKPSHLLVLTASSLILSGAVGNLVDRVLFGFVRDFIDLQFIKFYVFNVADCCICIGAALLVVYAFGHIEE